MTESLVAVTFGRAVGGALAAVVGGFARPVEPGDRLAVVAYSYRDRGEQLRIGRVQQPGKNQAMKGERTGAEPALPARGRGIELRKHPIISAADGTDATECLVRRRRRNFVKEIS